MEYTFEELSKELRVKNYRFEEVLAEVRELDEILHMTVDEYSAKYCPDLKDTFGQVYAYRNGAAQSYVGRILRGLEQLQEQGKVE